MTEQKPIEQANQAEQLAADIERLKAQYPELVNDAANEAEWLDRIMAALKEMDLDINQVRNRMKLATPAHLKKVTCPTDVVAQNEPVYAIEPVAEWIHKELFIQLTGCKNDLIRGWIQRCWTRGVHYQAFGRTTLINYCEAMAWISQGGSDPTEQDSRSDSNTKASTTLKISRPVRPTASVRLPQQYATGRNYSGV